VVGHAQVSSSSLVTSAERRGSSWGDSVRRGKGGDRWEQLLTNQRGDRSLHWGWSADAHLDWSGIDLRELLTVE
jgi:hypothetical protein